MQLRTLFPSIVGLFIGATNFDQANGFAPTPRRTTRTIEHQHNMAATLEGWLVNGNVKPVNNFVLVQVAEIQEKTDGGILLSKTAKVKKTEGKVISVGPGKTHQETGMIYPMPVSAGDGVLYGKYDGTEVTIDGVLYTFIRDDDILLKFKDGGGAMTLDGVEVVGDSILVAVEAREEETSGGLLLAASSSDNKRPSTGIVVKVGSGRVDGNGDHIPMNVNVGDEVKFLDFAGNEVKIENQEYSVVKMAEIYAKF